MQTLGRYQLLGQLATGGMAEIHLARLAGEAGFEKTVVVKRLLPELVASKAFVAMFLDEGKLVARIDHPNVCEVHELGREGNEYFLVMPYLDGVPATDFIARPRESDRMAQLRVAAGIVTQACAGLHHAHELRGTDGESLGLVHRDVSPSNLFITTAGVVKVLDFGVAKVRGGEATEVGTIKGKTQYMAPEQLVGEPLDRRCDVFALGIVLFELATHQRLFKRSSEFLTAKAILEEDIPRADAVDPAVPAPLADVIAKALSRPREARYAAARELAAAIEAAISVASSSEIASALASWHGEELSALRTRQRAVIAEASQVATAPGGRGESPPSALATTLGKRPPTDHRRRTLLPVVLASVVGIGVAMYFALPRGADPISDIGPNAGQTDKGSDPISDTGQNHKGSDPNSDTGRIDRGADPISDTGRIDKGSDPISDTRTSNAGQTNKGSDPISNAEQNAKKGSDPISNARPNGRQTGKGSDPISDTRASNAGQTDNGSDKPAVDKPVAKAKPGFFSIDSTPFATIFVDDKRLGITPLVKKQLSAGKHRVKAVLKDGRSKELTIDVPAGKTAPPVHLTW